MVKTSMTPGNKLKLRCPVLGTDQYFVACAFFHWKRMRGEATGRPDCDTIHNANKCAARHMLELEGKAGRPLFIVEDDKPRNPPKAVMERLSQVAIIPYHGMGTGIDPETLSRICGQKIDKVPVTLVTPADARKPKDAIKRSKPTRRVQSSVSDETGSDLEEALDVMVSDVADMITEGSSAG